MKEMICTAAGLIGSGIATLFGGWSTGMTTLVIFMVIDYIGGIIVAGVFKASNKNETEALESKSGWKGICRKGMSLLIVLIAYRLGLVIGTSYIRDAVIIGFIKNELNSIVEISALMGLPLPAVLTKTIDVLKKKVDKEEV